MATGSVMRPSNFRHDMRGPQVVEIRQEEYERTKRSILKKIRRRLVILGVIIGLLAVVAFALGGIIRCYLMNIRKFGEVSGSVSLRDLYFVYGGVSILFSLYGFYVDAKWNKLQQDGNTLIMHVRTYFMVGVGAWAIALWLGIATLSAFGLVDVQYISDSSQHLIYLTTLVIVTLHLLISPWLLRTIQRKGSQADEFFAAEFLSDTRNAKAESSEDSSDSSEEVADKRPAAVKPAPKSPRRPKDRSPRKNRKGSFKADANQLQLAMEGDSPRSARQANAAQPASPRSARRQSSPRISATATHTALATTPVESEAYLQQIPFASPVFTMDPEANLATPEFWQLWKQMETTGSFSCSFTNQPTRADLERRLAAQGFHVVAIEQKDSVLQVYFYGAQYGTDTVFLCEFVLLFARRFFQATFKCKEREAASHFVTRFNLNAVIALE